MKILQIGIGMIGSIVAKDLASKHEITVFDGQEANLVKLKKILPFVKCIHGSVDDEKLLNDLFESHDIVSVALPGCLAVNVVKKAILKKKNIFDISSIPNDILMGELKELAEKNTALYVPKIGIAPGMTNFLVGRGASELDEVLDVKIYVGGIPDKRVLPMDYKTVFCLEETIQEYLDPSAVVREGQLSYKPALSELHEVIFEDFNELEAFITDGLATLPTTICAKNMTEYTIRWSGHINQIKNLITLGLFEKKKKKISGIEISPRDYLVSVLMPLWKMDPSKGDRDVTLFRVIVSGKKEGIIVEIRWEMVDHFDEINGITSMGKCTGFTCSTFINAFAKNLIDQKGMLFPEKLAKNDRLFNFVLKELSEKGVRFKETSITSVEF